MRWRLDWLEPYEGKLSRTVPRGGRADNSPPLLDKPATNLLRRVLQTRFEEVTFRLRTGVRLSVPEAVPSCTAISTLLGCWSRHIVTRPVNIGDFAPQGRNKAVTKGEQTRNRFTVGQTFRAYFNDLHRKKPFSHKRPQRAQRGNDFKKSRFREKAMNHGSEGSARIRKRAGYPAPARPGRRRAGGR
jgi:hypothetical protein